MVVAIILVSTMATAKNCFMDSRIIHLSGLIVDSKTLQPLEAVNIFDGKGVQIGSTDKFGYYDININCSLTGPVNIQIKLSKKGFFSFVQKENWGDLKNDSKLVAYFGLQETSGKINGFSEFNFGKGAAGYNQILEGFSEIRKKRVFNEHLTEAKGNNEDVFLIIDSKPYIVSNTGWIQLNSDTDKVSINGETIVAANSLNSTIKRGSVIKMTPVEKGKGYDFYIKVR